MGKTRGGAAGLGRAVSTQAGTGSTRVRTVSLEPADPSRAWSRPIRVGQLGAFEGGQARRLPPSLESAGVGYGGAEDDP